MNTKIKTEEVPIVHVDNARMLRPVAKHQWLPNEDEITLEELREEFDALWPRIDTSQPMPRTTHIYKKVRLALGAGIAGVLIVGGFAYGLGTGGGETNTDAPSPTSIEITRGFVTSQTVTTTTPATLPLASVEESTTISEAPATTSAPAATVPPTSQVTTTTAAPSTTAAPTTTPTTEATTTSVAVETTTASTEDSTTSSESSTTATVPDTTVTTELTTTTRPTTTSSTLTPTTDDPA